MALLKKNTAPFGTLMNDWTTPELFTTPVPVSIKLVPSLEVIVNGSAPLLNTMLSSSTVVLLKRFVTFDVSKFAMSDGPFGTVFGIQLPPCSTRCSRDLCSTLRCRRGNGAARLEIVAQRQRQR